ncbi:MAG: hypothetical protein JXR22_02640 [Prolixibacteraceae bacterium]|nr:hypothetical protein [Prolixibacteraceae bacterium]
MKQNYSDKTRNLLFIILFLMMMMMTPTLFWLIPVDNEINIETSENRKKAEFPDFDLKHLDRFPTEFNDYYNDNFSLRPIGVKIYNRFNYFFLKKSPDDSKAILGKDNWIFQGKDLDYYRGLERFSASEQQKIKNEIQRRTNYLKSLNCKLLIVIIPTKKEIYQEYVPAEYFKYTNHTATDQFIDLTAETENLHVIDLRPVLTKAKSIYPEIYHRYDHHWNDYGAYAAYDTIVGYLQKNWQVGEKHQVSDFKEEIRETKAGSLAIMLGVADKISFYRYYLVPEFQYKTTQVEQKYTSPERFPYPYAYERRYQQSNSALPRLMMVNDSFGEYLYQNLAEHFSYSIFLFDNWEYNLHTDKIANEKPDLFVISVYESFLPHLLNNLNLNENKIPD